jgi:hypothetical protein
MTKPIWVRLLDEDFAATMGQPSGKSVEKVALMAAHSAQARF